MDWLNNTILQALFLGYVVLREKINLSYIDQVLLCCEEFAKRVLTLLQHLFDKWVLLCGIIWFGELILN